MRPFQQPEYFDIAAREVQGALDADLKRPYFIDNNVGGGQMLIEIQLSDGDVMDVLVPHVRLTFGSSFAYVLAQVGLALVLFGLAIWFMRRELVPIEHLGVAADALGKGRDVPDFAFSGGTREVRNAATAFQTMRIRLRRSIQQRTEMLAGVSHDLRTPLTRMKLSLALLPESPETKELADDVTDMERMIEGYLAFARGEGDEDPAPVDLAEILEDVAAGARRDNANVEVGWQGDMNVELRRARHQALPDQPRLQRAALRHQGAASAPSAAAPRSRSPSTTTAPASRPTSTRTCSGRSSASTNRATSTPAASASASPSRATWRAATAATWRSRPRRWAACASS